MGYLQSHLCFVCVYQHFVVCVYCTLYVCATIEKRMQKQIIFVLWNSSVMPAIHMHAQL